jgi:hypothetical protein
MSALDDAVQAANVDRPTYLDALAELARLRAAAAPKTCETCKHCISEYCYNPLGIVGRIGGAVSSFGCIHHEANKCQP